MVDRGGQSPALRVLTPGVPVRAVALVLHGGAQHGLTTVRPWGLAYLRMVALARGLLAAGGRSGLEVCLLRNRVRGWNEPMLHPVLDARWALDRVRARRPGLPVVLVGHSMGGRVALRIADDPAVAGSCALAPWTPRAEPVEPVTGRSVLIAHGTHDTITPAEDSHDYAVRAAAVAARVARFEIASEGHAMLRRPGPWSRLVAEFTIHAAGLGPAGDLLTRAWAGSGAGRFRVPL